MELRSAADQRPSHASASLGQPDAPPSASPPDHTDAESASAMRQSPAPPAGSPHDAGMVRRSRLLARIIVAFSLTAILSLDGLLAYMAVEEAHEVERTVNRDLHDNARLNTRLIENDLLQVARILSGINANLLRYLPQQVEGNAEIAAFLDKQLALLPLAGDIMVTDAQGGTLFWTGAEPAEDAACPACYAAARQSTVYPPQLIGPFVRPASGRGSSGGLDILFGQRLNDLFGNFIGLVTLTVNAATLSESLHPLTTPAAATVTVSSPDGVALAAAGQTGKRNGSLLTAAVSSPDFGFTVSAAVDRSSALTGWHQNNLLRALAAGTATLTLAALAFYAIRQIAILDRTFRNLEDMRNSLEAANATKTNFLANMSHELRTPLNAIIGFSDALLSGMFGSLPEPKVPEYLGYIRLSGRHLLTLINDVLDLAKIETGRFDVWIEPVDVVELCYDCVTMLDPVARPRGIAVTIERRTENSRILGDKRRLSQAFLNVIGNAVRYNRDGGTVTVVVSADQTEVVLTVDDTGIGMTPEELRTAFSRFGQAPSRVTADYGGTGLGLPICKGIVESHGGSLTLTSTKGKGTRSEIRLPLNPRTGGPTDAVPPAR